LNNQKEIDVLTNDFKANKQYFEDIETSEHINNNVQQHMSLYKKTLNKIISMVNVTKILDLNIEVKGNTQYHIVLTNKGIRQRYISGNYTSQSNDLYVESFVGQIGEAIKELFRNPELSTLQKNKIRPIANIDFSFLPSISLREKLLVKKVTRVSTSFVTITEDLTLPHYNTGYNNMSKFTLLSIRGQIVEKLAEFLKERQATIDMLKQKTKELEAMFPMVFLFGNQ